MFIRLSFKYASMLTLTPQVKLRDFPQILNSNLCLMYDPIHAPFISHIDSHLSFLCPQERISVLLLTPYAPALVLSRGEFIETVYRLREFYAWHYENKSRASRQVCPFRSTSEHDLLSPTLNAKQSVETLVDPVEKLKSMGSTMSELGVVHLSSYPLRKLDQPLPLMLTIINSYGQQMGTLLITM